MIAVTAVTVVCLLFWYYTTGSEQFNDWDAVL